ncbi:MAG: FxsA family protein [Solirubrobacterales bacterium]
MFVFILALLIVWPIAEIYVMVLVSQAIGFFWMLTLVFLSAVTGILVIRHRGRVHWQRLRGALGERRPPAREAFDGVMITTGAALLILPGFITSGIGLLLLFPPSRYVVRIVVFFLFASRFKVTATAATWTASRYGSSGSGGQSYDLEGEATDVTDRPVGLPPQIAPPEPEISGQSANGDRTEESDGQSSRESSGGLTDEGER